MKLVYKIKKNRATSFLLLKVLFMILVTYILYRQLVNSDFSQFSFNSINSILLLCLSIILVPLNWYLELLKWHISIDQTSVEKDRRRDVNAFFAGFVTGFVTPNMAGNFLGRMYYFEREHRSSIILLSLFSGFAQFLITLVLGVLTFFFAQGVKGIIDSHLIGYLSVIVIPVTLLVYFYFEKFIQLFLNKNRSLYKLAGLISKNKEFRQYLLGISLIRYLIFTAQYCLVLFSFGAEANIDLIIAVIQLFLITTMIPSLFFGKLGIRESIGLIVLGAVGVPYPVVIFSSLTVWIINLLLPTLLSLILVKRLS